MMGDGHMSKRRTSILLKIVNLMAVAGCVSIALVVIPGAERVGLVPHLSTLLFIVGSVPLLALAVVSWRLYGAIGAGEVFTSKNSRALRTMALLCAVDCAIWLVELVLYLALAEHLRFSVAASLLVALAFCFSLAIVCASLSAFTASAAELKDENDLVV
mgnify:FL=1|jgi:hypothetical protein